MFSSIRTKVYPSCTTYFYGCYNLFRMRSAMPCKLWRVLCKRYSKSKSNNAAANEDDGPVNASMLLMLLVMEYYYLLKESLMRNSCH